MKIHNNGKCLFYDVTGNSCGMLFANITGRNFGGEEYKNYLESMRVHGLQPGTVELRDYEDNIIESSTINF